MIVPRRNAMVESARAVLIRSGATGRVQAVREALRSSEFAGRFDAERKIREATTPMRSLGDVRATVIAVLLFLGADLRDVLITLSWAPAEAARPGRLTIDACESIEAAAAAVESARVVAA